MRRFRKWRAERAERQRADSIAWLKVRAAELDDEADSLLHAGSSAANYDSDMFGTATYSGWRAQERYNARAASRRADARECRARIAELESL